MVLMVLMGSFMVMFDKTVIVQLKKKIVEGEGHFGHGKMMCIKKRSFWGSTIFDHLPSCGCGLGDYIHH